ncbi:rRNA maturation RNase YbeY [bacterium]|nr:rRNA maturation RNase YbeY [bacterium]
MITIKNTQRKFKVDTKALEKTAQEILNELDYKDYDLGIWLTNNKTVRHYNKNYRNKDKATDILSFPYHANLQPGQRITVVDQEDKNVGDVIISIEFVHGILPLYNITLDQRLAVLMVHGICHLLGYSHYDEENDEKMSALEKKIAKKLKIKN